MAGASALLWAVLGLWRAEEPDRWTSLRIMIASLNACVGVLFIVRRPARLCGTLRTCLLALPSLLVGGMVVRHGVAPRDWPLWAHAVVTVGGGLALLSLVTLGRSFAIFPALRRVVTVGPYRVVRHPAYLGELIILIGCVSTGVHRAPALLLAIPLGLAAVVVRIVAEERLLSRDESYAAYAQHVRWRLLPGVW